MEEDLKEVRKAYRDLIKSFSELFRIDVLVIWLAKQLNRMGCKDD